MGFDFDQPDTLNVKPETKNKNKKITKYRIWQNGQKEQSFCLLKKD